MASTITTMVENIPGTPDLAALGSMNNRIVVVTKVPAIGKGSGQMVINGQTGMDVNDILALHDTLPTGSIAYSGPGLYRFEVTDQESGAKVIWQTRLGGVPVENPGPVQQARAAAAAPPAVVQAQQASRNVPLSPSVQHLGNGWYYNEELGLLTAPDGNLHTWRKGMALPVVAFGGPPPAPATPLAALPSLGASPEAEAMRQQLTALQTALAESRERERETQRQNELRDIRESMTKMISDANARTEAILAKLSEHPRENSEVADLKRRLESQEQLAAMRAETKATTDAIMALVRESTANKGMDPVIQVLTSMLTNLQANAGSNFTLLREMAAQERQTMERMMDRNAEAAEKSGSLEIVQKVMGGMDMVFDRLRQVTQLERELSGSGGGVDWMGVIREVGSKAGSALQAFQQAKAREAQAAEVQAQAKIAESQASVVHDRAAVAIANARQRAIASGQGSSAPAAASTTASTKPEVAPSETPVTATAPAPSPVPAPAPAGKPTGKKRVTVVEAEPQNLSQLSLKDLRLAFKGESDEDFFGGFVEYVQKLREELQTNPGGSGAEEIAGYVLQAREFIAAEAREGRIPHAAELLAHGQFAYLLERIVPDASEGLRSEIVKSIKRKLAIEADAARVAAATKEPIAS